MASETDRSEWPVDKDAFRIIETGKRDDQGRCSFTMFWWQGERARAQCFFAIPEQAFCANRRRVA